MPHIYSVASSGIVGVDLGSKAWTIHLKETFIQVNTNQVDFFFGIVFAYPPAEIQLAPYSVMSLVRAHITVAVEPNELTPIVKVALDGGSLDADKERTAEAFNMFKNKQRIKQAALDADIESAQEIIGVYWEIQDWIAEGMTEQKEILHEHTKLLLRP